MRRDQVCSTRCSRNSSTLANSTSRAKTDFRKATDHRRESSKLPGTEAIVCTPWLPNISPTGPLLFRDLCDQSQITWSSVSSASSSYLGSACGNGNRGIFSDQVSLESSPIAQYQTCQSRVPLYASAAATRAPPFAHSQSCFALLTAVSPPTAHVSAQGITEKKKSYH